LRRRIAARNHGRTRLAAATLILHSFGDDLARLRKPPHATIRR
jgi:hypothetical protein